MKQEELDNLIEEEFNEIKDKCKSRAKVGLYLWLAFLFLLILFLVVFLVVSIGYKGYQNPLHRQITFMIYITLGICAAGWLLLNNIRFLKRANSLDTPDKLLDSYEKKNLDGRKAYALCELAFTCFFIDTAINCFQDEGAFILVTIWILFIAMIAYIIYKYVKNKSFYVPPKDVAIIERLKELTEKK